MANLRKLARGRDCMIRIPGVCTFNPEQTVWCHARLIGVSGIGLKAADLLGAFGCSACHAVVDGQQASEYTYAERRLMLLEAMARSQAILAREGVITW